ncbi:hypothetical protein [Pseudomonas cannabina]|uniref:hypothetical protein n=1 Tax=Pseudomonas cannabina TaxID=86840 RepID=UPI000945A00A|nr:hypothetical protein [Pseudomonas cannabina]
MFQLTAEHIHGIFHLLVIITAHGCRCVATYPVDHLVRDNHDQVEAAMDQVQAHRAVDGQEENDREQPSGRVELSIR